MRKKKYILFIFLKNNKVWCIDKSGQDGGVQPSNLRRLGKKGHTNPKPQTEEVFILPSIIKVGKLGESSL